MPENFPPQCFDAKIFFGGNGNAAIRKYGSIGDSFALIHHHEIRRGKMHAFQRTEGGIQLHLVFAGGIAYNERKVAMQGTFQGGFERFDEMMGKIL